MSAINNPKSVVAAAEVPTEAVVPTPAQVPSPSGHLSPARSSTPAHLVDLNEVDLSFELAEDQEDRRRQAFIRHHEGPDAERVRRQVASEEVSRAFQQARQEIPR